MRTRKPEFLLAVALAGFGCVAVSAQQTPDRVTVPFSDPSRPGLVRAGLLNGSITVKAYNGKEVIIEQRSRQRDKDTEEGAPPGMRRLSLTPGLEIEEENNVIKIDTGSHFKSADLEIQVPARTSLKLSTVNGGQINVEGVEGDIEVENTNGSVTLMNVSGAAVAHALNGKVTAVFTRVTPNKPMSFSSMNGRIDVTFPPDLKANIKAKTENGDVWSDFDITLMPSPKTTTEGSRDARGKYRVKIDHAIVGTINGGGPEIQFNNFNGSIYIRKGMK